MPGTVAPSTPTPTDGPTDNDARRAAEAFMTGRGIEFEGFIESSAFRTVAGTSTYDITWTKISGGARYSFYEVSVNALTGNAYAFLDLRLQLPLTTPVLGRLGAITLVTEKLGVDASEATSAELAVDFSSGVVAWTWNIRLGTTLVRMDAATGVGTTVGSESPAPSS
jgi:hypothetical protein